MADGGRGPAVPVGRGRTGDPESFFVIEQLTDIYWLLYELPAVPKALWAGLLIVVVSIYFLRKARRNYMMLPELPRGCSGGRVDVAVVISARNEAHNIARCVGRFAPLGVRVVVVNDQSEDQTAEMAIKAGAEVMAAPALRRPALGKPNACQAGADAAGTKWILFVDADTWYHREFLPSLLTYAEESNLVLVSCFPYQVCKGIAEL